MIEQIQEVCTHLEQLIEETESLYGLLFETFPKMEKSIEQVSEETTILLDYFIRTQEEGEEAPVESQRFRLTDILMTIADTIEKVDESLLNRQEINRLLDAFLHTETDDKASMEDLLSIVGVIDKALAEIDLISLNAIIFAKRTGDKGASFSVIAGNIKNLSLKVTESNMQAQELIQSLKNWLEEFQNTIRKLLDFRDQITQEHAIKVKEQFKQAIASLGETGTMLHNLLHNVYEVIEPGRQIMVLIQNQDIIRQQMENMGTILQSLLDHEKGEEAEKEEILDQAKFRYEMGLLTGKIMETIQTQLEESVGEINQEIEALAQQLKDICEDSLYLSRFFGGQGQEQRGSVDETFARIQSFVGNFLQAVMELSQGSSDLTRDRKEFVQKIEATNIHIEAISGQLQGMEKLRLLSAIELARMGMKDHAFNKDIDTITQRVITAIGENKRDFGELKELLMSNLQELDETMGKSQKRVVESQAIIKEAEEELNMTNAIVNQAIHALHAELQAFLEEVHILQKDFAPASTFLQRSMEIQDLIQGFVNTATKEYEARLQEFDVEDWEIQDTSLQAVYNGFTTYWEKIAAKEFFEDIDLQERDFAGGELTLF